jgi:DNA-binding beta-propeller fold protein YncE
MYVSQQCYGLFVDINRTLYCSMTDHHQVVARSLDSDSTAFSAVIGSGCPGSASNMLYNPRGIFVDINFDLYVADCGNNRIQLFQLGQTIGSTVAGGVSGTITLNCPTDVVLDADNNLFIVDSNNHRIIGSGPNGFRCLLGCFETGSGRNQLAYPQSMAFDSYGNIFVTDASNNRIQKFIFSENPCSKYDYI